MAKPASVVSWATTGGTRLQPTAPEKAAGFAVGERVPARFLNWLYGVLGDWTTYLNGLEGEALTWTGAHSFANTVGLTNAVVLTNEATYLAAKTRKFRVPLREFSPITPTGSAWGFASPSQWQIASAAGAGDTIIAEVRVPTGCTVTEVRAFIQTGVGSTLGLIVERSRYSSSAGPTTAAMGLSPVQPASTSSVVTTGAIASNNTFTEDDLLRISVDSGVVANPSSLLWVEVTFTEMRATGGN